MLSSIGFKPLLVFIFLSVSWQNLALAELLVPEVFNLEDNAVIPAEVYKNHNTRDIGYSLVERIGRTMKDPDGSEKFHTLGLAPDKVFIDPSKQISLQLYFPTKFIPNVVENGFLNLHQKPDLPGYEKRIEYRNAIETGLARIRLSRKPSKNPQSPVNILRPKSVVLEFLLPPGERPVTKGATRYGTVVAVLKNSVKQRTTYTPYDSSGVFSSPYTTDDRLRKQVRPVLGRNYFFRPQYPPEYFEGQIWGELGIQDVEEFWVGSEIEPAALEQLKKANLNIFQYVEETVGVEKNGYYDDYHRRRGKPIFHGTLTNLKCSSLRF